MKTRKTWRQKLESQQEPRIVDAPNWQGKMLIPRPLDVDALMRQVPPGRLLTVGQIRERLASDFHADTSCPLCTGIFIRIAAEAAEEDEAAGHTPVTPYWRVLQADGRLNPKFPGGAPAQAARLAQEGHSIEPGRGKAPGRVKDFGQRLHTL